MPPGPEAAARADEAEAAGAKRRRLPGEEAATSGVDLPRLIGALPKDLGTAKGESLSLLLLRFLGSQDVVACCRATLDWWSIEGKRFVFCLNHECCGPKGPFAPLSRLVASHVEAVRLGRYGQSNVEERAGLVLACPGATSLRCVYAKLGGVGAILAREAPKLNLRTLRFHQCRLEAADVAELLCLCGDLVSIDCCGEALGGLGAALRAAAGAGRPLPTGLQAAEFTDCGLGRDDLEAFLELFRGSLQFLHCQASDLRGIRVKSLGQLKRLSLLDCGLTRGDAVAIMCQCPVLETLELCGNPLGEAAGDEESEEEDTAEEDDGEAWPAMPRLRRADFRTCGLGSGDEPRLRSLLGGGVGGEGKNGLALQVLAAPAAATAASPGAASASAQQPRRGHIVFESDSE